MMTPELQFALKIAIRRYVDMRLDLEVDKNELLHFIAGFVACAEAMEELNNQRNTPK